MRYVVYGAGAVGGVVGGLLSVAGCEVAVIARGAHLQAIRADGLTVQTPDTTHVLRLESAGSPQELGMRPDDVVFLGMKSNDTLSAVDALARAADAATPVVCLQNGVANERMALRHFAGVYGVCVMCPATHLEPGVVRADCSPVPGILDLGLFPSGVDDTAAAISAELRTAGFSSEPRPDIMRWKYAKLITNITNALDSVLERSAERQDIMTAVRAEAKSILDSAGIAYASDEEDAERRGDTLQVRGVRDGGSSWQSLTRGTGAIETDYINGEIVLIAREHGLSAPHNENAQRWANRFAWERRTPRTVTAADWQATL
jgi:2-dehydropantoate 2-reductase